MSTYFSARRSVLLAVFLLNQVPERTPLWAWRLVVKIRYKYVLQCHAVCDSKVLPFLFSPLSSSLLVLLGQFPFSAQKSFISLFFGEEEEKRNGSGSFLAAIECVTIVDAHLHLGTSTFR